MPKEVVTLRLPRKRRFIEENQTTCILCSKPFDEDKSGFPLDAWNCMREKFIEEQGKNNIWVSHVGVPS